MESFGDIGWGDPTRRFPIVMLAFLFVDIFDTAGTLYSVGRAAGYVDENDELTIPMKHSCQTQQQQLLVPYSEQALLQLTLSLQQVLKKVERQD